MGRTFSYSLSSSSASIRSGCREADEEYGIPASLCYYGGRVVVQTSRTDLNLGRRFFNCKNSEEGGVHAWNWFDDAVLEKFNIVKVRLVEADDKIRNMRIFGGTLHNTEFLAMKERLVEYEAKLKELELLAKRGVNEGILKFAIDGGLIGLAVISTAILRLFK
ncbi:unnamed protein product [Arabis nemorensis]|uniref:Zinc finger GRF-type domain-containing protein n=1 Tax=Arabis nemorensis TaxID=586526 RepID=A0A565BD02_9BRAS|nr:unnamed protein product [Arabis nemorensis]